MHPKSFTLGHRDIGTTSLHYIGKKKRVGVNLSPGATQMKEVAQEPKDRGRITGKSVQSPTAQALDAAASDTVGILRRIDAAT